MAVTLRDVAAHAGVSARTVSNVVNGFRHVSPGMRSKVQAALDELGYEPNLLARSLKQGRTGLITLLVPRIDVPYFAELAHEVVERASRLGVTVLIDETGGVPARELELLTLAASRRFVDGVLLSSLGLGDEDLARLTRSRVPVVLLGERTVGATHDHVGVDNVAAAHEATQHLLARGRRRVRAVGGPADGPDRTSLLRLQGHRQALHDAGLPVDEAGYVRAAYTRGAAADAVTAALSVALSAGGPPGDTPGGLPDGLVCFSAEHAVGSLRALHACGLRVPDDVSVVAFDDVEECRFATPPLTSVGPDRAEVASAALDLLLARIAGAETPPRDIRIPYALIPRESTGRR